MGNWFATFALLAWPVVAWFLYRSLSIGSATIWTILGGYLLLPVGTEIKFAMIPALAKDTVSNFAALLGCMLVARRPLLALAKFGLVEALILIYVLSPIVTSLLNTDPIRIGGTVIPGVGWYDGLSACEGQFLLFVPFFLGRRFLGTAAATEDILRSLALAGLLYSIPMMFEVRMSPQLHTWVYGYFPRSFLQQIREGGFRPVVFLGHGLLVAFFTMTSVVAAAALWRTQTRVARLSAGAVTAYLSGMLVLCKTASALIYVGFLGPLVRLASPRTQVGIAALMVGFSLLYPTLRATDLVPTETLLSLAASVSPTRAASLQTRFDQEKQLLQHAAERPLFGWGRYARGLVFDAQTGADISITDGLWIITMGQFGYLGFLAQFGLLALAVWRSAAALDRVRDETQKSLLAALALIVAISVIDLLPNASISPWTWLLAGALLGRAEQARLQSTTTVAHQVIRPSLFSPSRHAGAITRGPY